MALNPRNSFQCEPSPNDLAPGSQEPNQSHGSAVRKEEEISEFSSIQLTSFQHNNSCVRQELRRLYEVFHSCLQPEKHTKEEIISQLVLEQFIISGYCKDKSTLKEKWESSGRNLEKLMEDLTDDCMKPPVLVHVHMQGQEALFSENMPLKEVIIHLKQLAETSSEECMGTSSQTQNTPLETDESEDEGSCRNYWKTSQVNASVTIQGNQISSLSIIQKENDSRTNEDPHNYRSARPVTSRSLKGFYQESPMDVQPGYLSSPEQSSPVPVPIHQSNEENSTWKKRQEKFQGPTKPYKCEECPKTFRYLCHFSAHQRRHRNERPFVCGECHKGFYQASDLRVHNLIHTREKPFTCSTCDKSFSHKTNLQAHERIHTGEKPYTCSVCQRSYRQSSTYHRHLKIHQKIRLKSVPSTP